MVLFRWCSWNLRSWMDRWDQSLQHQGTASSLHGVSASAARAKRDASWAIPMLPSQYWSQQEMNSYHWLQFKSWSRCSACGLLCQRVMHCDDVRQEGDIDGHIGSKCEGCKNHRTQYIVPTFAQLPAVMINLDGAIKSSLTLLNLHQGDPKKHANGHFRKDKLSRLSWVSESVESRIAALSQSQRLQAQAAFDWLTQNSCGYTGWLEVHREFLANDATPNLLPSALQESFVEVALWPHLYCLDDWCESSLKAPEAWSRPFTGHHQTVL